MKVSHNYNHSHKHDNASVKPIFIAFLLNIIFAAIEFIGFLFSGSMILFSSSIHDIGDSTTLFATVLIEKKANNGRDEKYSYGYRRFSLIGSTINYTILLLGSVFAIFESIKKLFYIEVFDPRILMYVSLVGILINIIGFKLVNTNSSLTSRALAANLFSDIVNFIAIFISSLFILNFHFYLLDPLFSIGFSLYLIWISVKAFLEIFKIIMQAIPDEIEYNMIKNEILDHEFILDVHDIHIWDLDSEDIIFTAHIVVQDSLNDTQLMEIKEHIRQDLEEHGINHSTIEIDTITHSKYLGEIPKHTKCSND